MATITRGHDRLHLSTPFHPAVSVQARRLGGAWRGKDVGWVFPLEAEPAVRDLCLHVWGVDGSASTMQDRVTLRVEVERRVLDENIWAAFDAPVFLIGREIAGSLPGGRGIRVGRGVRFLAGAPAGKREMTGAVWTIVPEGSVFTVADFPRMALSRLEERLQGQGRFSVGGGA